MPDPVLHLLVGPNGAGKSSLYEMVIGPTTRLEFINADAIAAQRWPGDTVRRSYDAAVIAADLRSQRLAARVSFVAETVFSHQSKLDVVRSAIEARYLVTLHIVMVPEDLAVARVVNRVSHGGHPVPEEKVRQRHRRLWPLVAAAVRLADNTIAYDNSRADRPFRPIATFEHGVPVGRPSWPVWAPDVLRDIDQRSP